MLLNYIKYSKVLDLKIRSKLRKFGARKRPFVEVPWGCFAIQLVLK